MRKEAYERIFACIQKTRYGVKIINGIRAAVVVWVLGIVLAVTRVAGGVHFPKDVIAGMCIGIILGAACRFFLY